MPATEPWSAPRAAEMIAGHADREGAMLPVLHALQEAFGFVHEEAVPLIAEALNVSKAEVHGCITFYHDFRAGPAGRRRLARHDPPGARTAPPTGRPASSRRTFL